MTCCACEADQQEFSWMIDMAQIESELLNFYVELDTYYQIRNVATDEDEWVHCLIMGDKENPPLLMLHGHAGNYLMYVRMFKELSNKYRVICFDMPGTGLSSRQPFKPGDLDEAIQYFTRTITGLCKSLQLTKVHLMGHSLGGMILTYFLEKHPEMVSSLTLLSPLGCHRLTQEQAKRTYQFVKIEVRGRFKDHVLQYMYQRKLTPSWIFSSAIGKVVINGELEERFLMKDQELQLWARYMRQSAMVKFNSQQCIFWFMGWPFHVNKPLDSILIGLSPLIKIQVFYGDKDWMYEADGKYFQQEIESKGIDISVHIVKGADHQMIFNYPRELLSMMKQCT